VDGAAGYSWPLRPFDKQQVIRSSFGEPRFGAEQRNFHFGVDLPAAGGTPCTPSRQGQFFSNRITSPS
jgi:murein DD-endopeptidase MepM/ murein hydrolase activator NlpD